MYSYGYGQQYSSTAKNRETDYMDLKHPWFNLRNYQPRNNDSDDDNDEHDDRQLERRLATFTKKQTNDKTIQEIETLGEAPLLHSEAQNLQARDQGYKSSLPSNSTTTTPSTTTTTSDPTSPQSISFTDLAEQLESQYDYRICSDCKIQSKYVCIQCHDSFCAVCYASNHRRGRRITHQRISLELYLTQRKNGIPHDRIPDELPQLIDPIEEEKNRLDSQPRQVVMNLDYEDDSNMQSFQSNNPIGIISTLSGYFSSMFGRSQQSTVHYSTQPVTAVEFITADEASNLTTEQLNGTEPIEGGKRPYIELPDDPTQLDGWWRGTPRHWLRGRAKFIPLRLTHEERYHLRLLTAVLTSCDYLSVVDNNNNVQQQTTNIKKRNINMVSSCMAILTALIAAKSIPCAMEQNISKYQGYLEHVLELGVRSYLLNQKQTGWISVLLCLLQDLQSQQVVDVLGCKIKIEIRTVHTLLYPRNMLYVLDSNLMYLSTEPICVDTKSDLAKRISARKSKAIKTLTTQFAHQKSDFTTIKEGEVSEQTLLLCLYSIGDHNLNLHFTRDVCTRIGRILCGLYRWDHTYHIGIHRCVDTALINAADDATYEDVAKAITVDLDSLLRLQDGQEMPLLNIDNDGKYSQEYDVSSVYNNDLEYMVHQCLSTQNKVYSQADEYQTTLHQSPMFRTHTQHLQHVLQTISLWETITHYLPFISYLSVVTFLDVDSQKYTLCNNGQGIVRVQPSMLLQRVMVALVVCALRGVGSQAVHIGDSAVPNALALIDKYLQLNTILTPLMSTARYWWTATSNQANQEAMKNYRLATFTAKCIEFGHKKMLQHWSIHGMDGSGGDTVFTSGSCADGRLTSVWNWCNLLPNQHFYPLFLLAGFTSFDQVKWD